MPSPVIAVFDIGRTNKKVFLFDEEYKIVFEKSEILPEALDEDGFPCEDLAEIRKWVLSFLGDLLKWKQFEIKAVNVSAHGAGLANLDHGGNPVTPLYNYLKPFPEHLKRTFYDTYGLNSVPLSTASPILGHLNSAMQLYWLRHARPQVFERIKYALHLPEYISHLVTGKYYSGITSIGCHTQLWNFEKQAYHDWVSREGILDKLAPIFSSKEVIEASYMGRPLLVGVGLHDSSAALIPYTKSFADPFLLISTGTWSISLNPFNHSPLTLEELHQDCLCYLSFDGSPVKAARLFLGHEHDLQAARLAGHFHINPEQLKSIKYDPEVGSGRSQAGDLSKKEFNSYPTVEAAYHAMIEAMIDSQAVSAKLVLKNSPVANIFVDGGFSRNHVYMNMLAHAFPGSKVLAASMAQASALGAALAIHEHWNPEAVPSDLIEIQVP